jgi:hypothetical protein
VDLISTTISPRNTGAGSRKNTLCQGFTLNTSSCVFHTSYAFSSLTISPGIPFRWFWIRSLHRHPSSCSRKFVLARRKMASPLLGSRQRMEVAHQPRRHRCVYGQGSCYHGVVSSTFCFWEYSMANFHSYLGIPYVRTICR